MTKNDCINYIKTYLDKVIGKITSDVSDTPIFISEDNIDGFMFTSGLPVSFFPVATSAGEDVGLQTGSEAYLNTATNRWWTKTGNNWTSVPFDGTQGTLRRDAIVIAKNTGNVFLYARNNGFHPINTTTSAG